MHAFRRPSLKSGLLDPIHKKQASNWGEYMTEFSDEHHALSQFLWCDVQEFFCAYCERVIPPRDDEAFGNGHIEHRERIRDNQDRMGDWTNLFFSCNDPKSCGHFKDDQAGEFNIADIIDPAVEDPSRYFRYDGNGGVSPVEADAAHPQKAAETIRVFNLDKAPALRAIRRGIAATVEGFIQACDGHPSQQQTDEFLHGVQSLDCPSVYKSLLCEMI